MIPDVEDRLRAHVTAILAGADVPGHARDDLAEELFGHLVERVEALVVGGLSEDEAAKRAMADFGATERLGRELTRAYHSRLWASTIGVLLAGVGPVGTRPRVVGWLRFVLALVAVLTALAALGLPTQTPTDAIVTGLAASIGLAVLVLAFRALARGQRWALAYAIGATLILLFEGVWSVIEPEPLGSVTIPLGAILAAVVLLMARAQWEDLKSFVAPSPPINRLLGIGLTVTLLAQPIAPRLVAAMPDPTQVTTTDLDLRLEMTCDRADVTDSFGTALTNTRRATVIVDARWSRTDLWPAGLAGIVTRPDEGDTIGIRFPRSVNWWDWTNEPSPVDIATGKTVGSWGSTSPSVALLPSDVAGSFTVAIDPAKIQPHHVIRTTWVLVPGSERKPWPRVEVLYAHLDRFVLAGRAECNGISHGVPVQLPIDEPAVAADDFPLTGSHRRGQELRQPFAQRGHPRGFRRHRGASAARPLAMRALRLAAREWG